LRERSAREGMQGQASERGGGLSRSGGGGGQEELEEAADVVGVRLRHDSSTPAVVRIRREGGRAGGREGGREGGRAGGREGGSECE
jgi:hypothetical protein